MGQTDGRIALFQNAPPSAGGIRVRLTDGAAAGVSGCVSSRVAHALAEAASFIEPPADLARRAVWITVEVRRTAGPARRRTVHRRAERERANCI